MDAPVPDAAAPALAAPAALPAPPPPQPLSSLGAWTALDLLVAATIAVGIGFAAALALGAAAQTGWALGAPMAALGGLPALLVPLSLIGSPLAGIALWAMHRRRLPAAPRPWSAALAFAVVAVALALQGAAVGFTALMQQVGTSAEGRNLAIIADAYAAAPAFTLLMTVLLAPLGEELVFRRVLLHRFAQARRPWLGLAVTSLAFALIHEPLPGGRPLLEWALTLATYASLGLGFGLLYLRSGRLDSALLAHVIVNAVGMALLLAR